LQHQLAQQGPESKDNHNNSSSSSGIPALNMQHSLSPPSFQQNQHISWRPLLVPLHRGVLSARINVPLWGVSSVKRCVCVTPPPVCVFQVVQPDRYTLALRLRTPLAQGWLHLSWHPTAARLCVGRPPARGDVSEGFTLAQQVGAAGWEGGGAGGERRTELL